MLVEMSAEERGQEAAAANQQQRQGFFCERSPVIYRAASRVGTSQSPPGPNECLQARKDHSSKLNYEPETVSRIQDQEQTKQKPTKQDTATDQLRTETVVTSTQKRQAPTNRRIDIRLLVRRREAGALIGKRGANIKRMREIYKSSSFNIPDTGNGPERVVCISSDSWQNVETILLEISQLFLDKSSISYLGEEQVELKQLINSAYAGLLIGIGGQSIRKLRNDSRAAIKIYEMCCPLSDERVCAIKARPPVVVSTIRLIYEMMLASQATIMGPIQANKPYDALNFDLNLVDKYGGYIPDDCCPGDLDGLACFNGVQTGAANPNQPSYLHHRPKHPFEQFDLADQTKPPPLVIPPNFRPDSFLGPFQPFDLVQPYLHVPVDAHDLTSNPSFNRLNLAPGSSPASSANSLQEARRLRASSGAQTYRNNQRFQPYAVNQSLQARCRFLQQQQQLMINSQLLERMSHQLSPQLQPPNNFDNPHQFGQRLTNLAPAYQGNYGNHLDARTGPTELHKFRAHHRQHLNGIDRNLLAQSLGFNGETCSCFSGNKSLMATNGFETSHRDQLEAAHLCRLGAGSHLGLELDDHARKKDKSFHATQTQISTDSEARSANSGPI